MKQFQKTALRIIRILLTIYLLFALTVAGTVAWAQLFDNVRIPSLFGCFFVRAGEDGVIDGVGADDVLLIHRTGEKSRREIAVEDVIVTADETGVVGMEYGRVISVNTREDGTRSFLIGSDRDRGSMFRVGKTVEEEQAVGLWRGGKLPHFGGFHDFLWSFPGYLTLILLPLLLWVAWLCVGVIRNFRLFGKLKAEKDGKEDSDDEKI